MKNKKLKGRILSLILSAVMVFTTLPTAALAEMGDPSFDASTINTIASFDQLGDDFTKSVPFDGYTYALNVELGTPFEEIQLPTKLAVTMERITTASPSIADEEDDLGDNKATPSDIEEDVTLEDDLGVKISTTSDKTEMVPVIWKGDRGYTPEKNSKVVYTVELPKGYAVKDGVELPQIYVMVGRQARAAAPNTMISFDARNGEVIVDVEPGEDGIITMPTRPTWNYTFDGWYTGIDGTGTKITADTVHVAKATVYAKWTKGGKTVYTNPIDFSIATENLVGEGYMWDAGTKTLTLSGTTIIHTDKTVVVGWADTSYGIQLPRGATIELQNGTENTVMGGYVEAGSVGKSVGIFVDRTEEDIQVLTIKGTGTLNALGGRSEGGSPSSVGISSSDHLNVIGGTINATGGEVIGIGKRPETASIGIDSKSTVIVDGVILNAIGGNATASGDTASGIAGYAESYGLISGEITITGGKVNAVAGSVTHETDEEHKEEYSTGIAAWGGLQLSGNPVIHTKGSIKAVTTGDDSDPKNKVFITAEGANVVGAKETFVSGKTTSLTQSGDDSVVITFGPSITVGKGTGKVIYGTGGTSTFAVTGSSFGGEKNPMFAPKIQWISGSAPIGVTAAFSNGMLTVNVTATTPANEYKFKVVSPKTGSGNYESEEAILKVNKLDATIQWGEITSFPYNGGVQAPVATISNKVSGDDVTISVTGGQINIGTGYIATADALLGIAASNYAMPSTKPTQIFTITKAAYNGKQVKKPSAGKAIKTHDRITLEAQIIDGETVEYGYSTKVDGAITWKDSPDFTELLVNTEYYFFVRVKENNNHDAGTTSDSTKIRTKHIPTTVSGAIKDSANIPVDNATIELKQGDTVVMRTTTNSNGSYNLTDVETGAYNLTITRGTVTITELIIVAGEPITSNDMQFLSGEKNTVVESTLGTPEISAGGMTNLLKDSNLDKTLNASEKTAVDSGGSVEIKVRADGKTGNDVVTDKRAIQALAVDKKINMLLDLSVLKTVKDHSGITVTDEEKLTTLTSLIKIILQIPDELQGKPDLTIYRVHNGIAQALSTTPDVNGEYFEISEDETYMILYVKNFSTYALGYTAHSVTVLGAGIGGSWSTGYDAGDMVELYAGTKSSYRFSGWTSESTGVILEDATSERTSFTMPKNDVIVTANWTYKGGSTNGDSSSSNQTIVTSVPTGYTGGTRIIGNVRVPDYTVEGTWRKNENGTWDFSSNGGVVYQDCWVPVFNPYADVAKGQNAFDWFKFDANGIMLTGWYTDKDGNRYYLNPISDNTLGAMQTGRILIDGMYYYFNEMPDGTRGKLLKNTTTPEGYLVDENGVWNGSKN